MEFLDKIQSLLLQEWWRILSVPFTLLLLARLHQARYDNIIILWCRRICSPILSLLQLVFPVFMRIDFASVAVIYGLALARVFQLNQELLAADYILALLLAVNNVLGVLQLFFIILMLLPMARGNFFTQLCSDIVLPYIRFVLYKTNIHQTKYRFIAQTFTPLFFFVLLATIKSVLVANIYLLSGAPT